MMRLESAMGAASIVAPDRGRPMRLLFITDAFLPHAGGARVYYYHLLRHLADHHNTEVTILTKKIPGWREFDRAQTEPQFRIIRCGRPLPTWKYQELPKIALPLARAVSLLAARSFDLLHFGDLYPPGVLSMWFHKVFRIPYVGYCHGEEITLTDRFRHAPKVRNAIYRNAGMVVAANEFARQNLLRIGIADERIRKITPGVDFARFRPLPPRRELLERFDLKGKKVLLSVARLVPRKGHRTVLEALRLLLPEIPNLVFLVAGTGPEQDNLRRAAAEWNLSDAVRFAGFVPDEDLPDFYNAADVFVLPNFEDRGDIEGFGMVFLEANACGKPVVGGKSGGTAEAILDGTTGILVNPQDPAELASVLRGILSDGEWAATLGKQGLARARSEFSWGSRAQLLASTNDQIVSGLHPARS